jgi:curved DNA-binding protein CbpA
MNDLHKAYHALGLEPGAPFEIVKRRYRRLALVWHPDRMTNADGKREAEEELKKINNNFEKLRKHFETQHKSGPSCRCQPAAAGPPPNNSAGGGANQKRREEEAARKRTEERHRQTAEAEAAQRAAEASGRADEKQKAAEEAIKGESARKEEALRWKCAVVIGITFIALVAYCWIGCAVRDVVHGIGRQWDSFQAWLKPKIQNQSTAPSANTPKQPADPYIPPYEQFPRADRTSWRPR